MRNRVPYRYMPWIARDYFLWGGVATAVIMSFVALIFVEQMIMSGARANPAHPLLAVPLNVLHRSVGQLLGMLAVLGPVIATRGIIASDRTSGYYKLLFARPINGPSYYAATFIINGIGFLIVTAALQLLFSWLVVPIWPPRLFPVMALSYLFLGGIAFLLSSLWRYDLLSFIAVYVASATSWDVLTSPGPKGWLIKAKYLVELLPPVHVLSDLVSGVPASSPFTWVRVSWVTFYGLACFGLGLWILKRRQFRGS